MSPLVAISGERLRRARVAKDMSGRSLSAAAGLAPAVIGHLERGIRKKTHSENLRTLATVLGVDEGWLSGAKTEGGSEPTDTDLLDWLDTLPSGVCIMGDRDHPQTMCMTPKQVGFSHTRDLIKQAMKYRKATP